MRIASSVAVLTVALLSSAPTRADDSSREARSTIRPARVGGAKQLSRTGGEATLPSALEELREQIEEIWSGRVLHRGVTAVYVVDAETGRELFRVHEDEKVNPASNVKLISTATVLDTLGPDWRYRTRLFGAAPDESGTVAGGLYLRGMGDPTLGAGALEELAESLAAAGVRRIDGDVLLSDDEHRDTLATSTVKVTVRGRGSGAPDVSVTPMSDFVRVEVKARIKRRGRTRLRVKTRIDESNPEAPRLVVEVDGRIRRGTTRSYRRGVHRRSTFTGHTLRRALRDAGIEVTGAVRLADLDAFVAEASRADVLPVVLAEHGSWPIEKLVSRVNKKSLNWLADRLVMTAGAHRYGGEPTMEKGVRAMEEWLAGIGIDPDDVVLDTGSGLSYETELTARQIVEVLRAAAGYTERSESWAEAFRDSLAIGGVDGTLGYRFRNSPVHGEVIAKTGTLTEVIALSGFVAAPSGRTLCFAIVSNGHRHRRRSQVRLEHEHMVEALYSFLQHAPTRPTGVPADAEIAATDAAEDGAAKAAPVPTGEALVAPDDEIDAIEAEDDAAETDGAEATPAAS